MFTDKIYDDYLEIKTAAEERLVSIQERYNDLNYPSAELTEKVEKLEVMVEELEIASTLDYHLELKLLVQEIEKLLVESPIPGEPEEPTIETLTLALVNEKLQATTSGITDEDGVLLNNFVYQLKNNSGTPIENIPQTNTDVVTFNTTDAGTYTSTLTYFYDLGDGAGVQSKTVDSNAVTIEEEVVGPEEPTIETLTLALVNEKLQATTSGVEDKDGVLLNNFVYQLNNENGTPIENHPKTNTNVVTFNTTDDGTYTSTLIYFYDLEDGAGVQSKTVDSNSVTIEDEAPGDEFPEDLPFSNTWAYATHANNQVEITLNNTWGVISNELGVYINNKLAGTETANHTASNKGSAKNTVDLSKYGFNSTDDIKVLYKVTFARADKAEGTVVYYKSTTGVQEIAYKDGDAGEEKCTFCKWSPEINGAHTSVPNVWYDGKHWSAKWWIDTGDVPGGNNGWGEVSHSSCPNPNDSNVHPEYNASGIEEDAHLTPLDPSKVEGLGEPMEKMHISYFPEWAKWGGRSYTPKIAPWNKVSHFQYSFIDVRPNYTGDFDLDGDMDIRPILDESVKDCPNYSGGMDISPNIFDPGAAFSPWGGTNAAHPEFVEYNQKYPSVVPSMSLGGYSRSGFFRDAVSDNRAFFVQRCVDLMRILSIRAIDIDWEWPGTQRDADLADIRNDLGTPRATADEYQLFTVLMKDLREALDAAGEEDGKYYHLTCAIGAGKNKIDVSGVSDWHQYCDFISYMTYDIHGAFDGYTNHQTCLHQNEFEDQSLTNPDQNAMSVEDVVNYVNTQFGVPKKKLVVGTPMYSRGWSGVKKSNQEGGQWPIPTLPGLFAKVEKFVVDPSDLQGRAAPGVMDGGRGAGVMSFRHINALIDGRTVTVKTLDADDVPNPFDGTTVDGTKFTFHYDSIAQIPYLFNEEDGIFYTYENEQSLGAKTDWIISEDLAGIISWDISLDDFGTVANGLDETYNYASLEVEEHKLTNVIFDKFKSSRRR